MSVATIAEKLHSEWQNPRLFPKQYLTCDGNSFNLLFRLHMLSLATQLHYLYQDSEALSPQPCVLIAQHFWNSSTPCPLPYGLTRAKDIVFTSPRQGSAKYRIKPLHKAPAYLGTGYPSEIVASRKGHTTLLLTYTHISETSSAI